MQGEAHLGTALWGPLAPLLCPRHCECLSDLAENVVSLGELELDTETQCLCTN